MSHGPLSQIDTIIDARSRRKSSFDVSGGNEDWHVIPARQTHTLAQIEGAGIIRHMWVTIASDDPMHRRNLVLRMYWDGSPFPSVEAPIGDFFGQGWGMRYNFA